MLNKVISKISKIRSEKDLGEILTGGAVAFLYRLATMATTYFLLIFISRKLGKEGVGIYNLCLATSGILVMVGCLGFNTAIVRFVSEYRSKKFLHTIRSLYGKIIRLSILISGLITIVLFFGSEFIATRLFDDVNLIQPLRITAFIVPLMVLATLNVEFIRGLKQVHVSEYLRNLNILLITLAGTYAMTFFVLTPEDPLRFYAVGAGISALVGFIYVNRFFRREASDVANPEEAEFEFKPHLLIALPMIITAFIQLINGKVDTLMLAYFETTALVGVFSMAFKLSVITNFVIGALKTIAMPKISELFWGGETEKLNRVISFSTLIIFLFAFPISLLLFLFPEFVLNFVSEEFVEGATTLRIFAVSQLINAASGMVAVFLNMSGNQAVFTRIALTTTCLNIILNLILIPRYGIEGAAIATLIANASWNIAGAVFIYRKHGISTFFNPLLLLRRKG